MIEIYNQTKQKINKKIIQKNAQEIFENAIYLTRQEINQKNVKISIVFIGEKKIKLLNKKYREKNKTTDVLSFGLWKLVHLSTEQNYFGEIFICYLKIIKQAKTFQHSISKELKIILIHSILHLLGYDHKIKKDWEEMKEMEEKLLNYKL